MKEKEKIQPVRDIDLSLIADTVRNHKWQILINLLVVAVCAGALIIFLPRSYHSESKMILEQNSYIAASMKKAGVQLNVNIGDPQRIYDAYIKDYDDIVKENRFLCNAVWTKVTTREGKEMYYGEYIRKHHVPLTAKDHDPMRPSLALDTLMKDVKENIKFRYDVRRASMYMNVLADDPLVCQQVCKAQTEFLLKFIAEYRTKKKQSEVNHFKNVADSLRQEYLKAWHTYSAFCDSHLESTSSAVAKQEKMLEEEMIATKNLYENVKVEYMSSKARLQDATPAFIYIQNPAIPAQRTGPDRFLFFVATLLITLLYSVIFHMRHVIWAQITR